MENCFSIDHSDKFFPNADNWMWHYATYLGKFVDSNGKKYDLGVFIAEHGIIYDATVFDNKDGSYSSGEITDSNLKYYITENHEWFIELVRRAKILKVI